MTVTDGKTIVLADGTVISAETGETIKGEEYVEVPRHSEAVREITERRRRLVDLPEAPSTMNVVSTVVGYALIGLSNIDIARALSIDVDQVTRIRETPAFDYMATEMTNAILEHDAEDIRILFRSASQKAAKKITNLIESETESVALAAAKDALDRDGFRPADVVELRRIEESTLRIEIVKKIDDAGTIIEGEAL